MTEKIYETDGVCYEFDATVKSCEREGDGYAVILDRTAFFPGGGGQEADTGRLGNADVTAMLERDGEIYHITSSPLEVGAAVHGVIDGEARLRRMQNHGGEHIVSGIVNRKYGFNNVGFHMGDRDITIDFDGVLDREQLCGIELEANRAVVADRRILISFPTPDELAKLSYRSKKALSGRVRIVEIEGFDRCACCAPHLPTTGGVGIIKILDFMHYKGGVRVHLICGLDALADYHRRYTAGAAISALLSVPQEDIAAGVEKLNAECGSLRGRCGELSRRLLSAIAGNIAPTDGNICVFEDADASAMRYFVNLAVEKCGGMCGIFAGNDKDGYRYIIGSKNVDLRARAGEINRGLNGRGGGTSEMIQGSVAATKEEIGKFFNNSRL